MSETIKEVLKYIKLKPINGMYKGRCPYHNNTLGDDASMIVIPESKKFHCFSCGKDGSIDELVEKLVESYKKV